MEGLRHGECRAVLHGCRLDVPSARDFLQQNLAGGVQEDERAVFEGITDAHRVRTYLDGPVVLADAVFRSLDLLRIDEFFGEDGALGHHLYPDGI